LLLLEEEEEEEYVEEGILERVELIAGGEVLVKRDLLMAG
jgi:hypothetical protein